MIFYRPYTCSDRSIFQIGSDVSRDHGRCAHVSVLSNNHINPLIVQQLTDQPTLSQTSIQESPKAGFCRYSKMQR